MQLFNTVGAVVYEDHSASARHCVENAVARGISLENVDLSWTELENCRMKDGVFTGAVFIGANLAGANLVNAQCDKCNFTAATLRKSNLTGANVSYSDFTAAILVRATLCFAKMRGACFDNARMRGVIVTKELGNGVTL